MSCSNSFSKQQKDNFEFLLANNKKNNYSSSACFFQSVSVEVQLALKANHDCVRIIRIGNNANTGGRDRE